MKTLTKKNLIKFLVERGACKRGLTWAKKQRRGRDIVEKCTNASYLYWLILVIGGPMLAEYREKTAPFWAEYREKEAPLWAEYWEKEAPIWAEYLEKGTPLWAEYDKKCNILAKELCTFERVQEAIGS